MPKADDFVGAGLAFRPELVTPLTSPRRIAEGVFLRTALNTSAYAGGICKSPPLVVALVGALLASNIPLTALRLCWVLVDAAGAIAAGAIAKLCDDARERDYDDDAILRAKARKDKDSENAVSGIQVGPGSLLSIEALPGTVCAAYALNPLTFLVWASGSLAAATNAVVLCALALGISRYRAGAAISLALAAYLEPFCICLVVPALIWRTRSKAGRAVFLLPFGATLLLLVLFQTSTGVAIR